jgi:SAM-dependent methyltransferase
MAPNNTNQSFKDKWEKNQDLTWKETLREGSEIQEWILNRNSWINTDELRTFLSDKKRILDAGCGNGRILALLRENSDPMTSEITGIDLVSDEVARNNLQAYQNINIYKKDLLDNLSSLGKFDFIYCQEVLHHTDRPQEAFNNLVNSNLNNNGIIAIYVYKQKAPVREFTDDYIRDKIKTLSYNEAIAVCNQVTEFGKALSELDIKVNLPEVSVLEIEEGEYSIQRLIYYFFMKCFWNPNLSFEQNSAINYDWYHPQNCFRYKPAEIRKWFNEANLEITHEYVDPYGITMHGKKTKIPPIL